jgi:L-alanine-DL-glutamate epimerase-like enolase superfamily enzyme
VRITSLETIIVDVSSDGGNPPAGAPGWSSFPTLLVRIDTDEQLVGWGEAYGYGIAPATKAFIDDVLAPPLADADPLDRLGVAHRLNRTLHYYGRNGPFSFGLAGIDIALWDLAGKAAGLPIHALLGGTCHREVETYASLVGYRDPDVVGSKCAEAVSAGYRHIKLHERDVAAVAAAREAIGPDIELMLDTNCAWTREQALRLAPVLRPHDLRWVEDAVWPPEDHASLAELRRAGLRISAGENLGTLFDFRHLCEMNALDVAQPDATKIGGITEMWKVAALAEAYGLLLSPHNAGFGPGYLASLQVLAALPSPSVLERVYVRLETCLYPELAEADSGRIEVPAGPGLGLDPDPDVIARQRR